MPDPSNPLSALQKATSLSNDEGPLDQIMNWGVGAEGYGQGMLGKALTGLDQLTYGHMREEDPQAQAAGPVSVPGTVMGDLHPSLAMAVKVPEGFRFHPNPAINAKLASLAAKRGTTPELLSEVMSLGPQYEAATSMGDATAAKEIGKRLAELDRIGRTGQAFTPSTSEVMSASKTGLEPSKTIINARLKAALEGLKGK